MSIALAARGIQRPDLQIRQKRRNSWVERTGTSLPDFCACRRPGAGLWCPPVARGAALILSSVVRFLRC